VKTETKLGLALVGLIFCLGWLAVSEMRHEDEDMAQCRKDVGNESICRYMVFHR